MSVKVKRMYGTFFKRTKSEIRQAEMSKELEDTRRELAELKEYVLKLSAQKEGEAVASPSVRGRKKKVN